MMRLMPHNVMGSKQAVRLAIGLSLVLGVSAGQAANETIQISGSSTVYPITKAAIEDFNPAAMREPALSFEKRGPAQVSGNSAAETFPSPMLRVRFHRRN